MATYRAKVKNAGFLGGFYKPGDVIEVTAEQEKQAKTEGNVLGRYFEKVEAPKPAPEKPQAQPAGQVKQPEQPKP